MSSPETTLSKASARGALWTVLVAFPVAALLGLLFRFPVPFDGIEGGITHMLPSLFAVIFYGLMGGFILLAGLGAIGGAIAFGVGHGKARAVDRLTLFISCGIASVLLFVLSISDWIIGPW